MKSSASRTLFRTACALLIGASPVFFTANAAHALSELQPAQTQDAQAAPAAPTTPAPATPAPATPDPTAPAQPAPGADQPSGTDDENAAPDDSDDDSAPDDAAPDDSGTDESTPSPVPDEQAAIARPDIEPNAPLAAVEYDVSKLPEAVQKTRQALITAAETGDIEKLRPLIPTGADAPLLSLSELVDDPIDYLKSQSGDDQGQEILAILEEVLNAGYVHLNVGKPTEIYAWPYFFGLPLDKLTGPQKVELFKIITAGDFEDMRQYGTYLFYRVGITPAGKFAFFVAGE